MHSLLFFTKRKDAILMNQSTIQLIIILIVSVCVLATMLAIFPYLKSKGTNVSGILDNAKKATDALAKALSFAQEILPNNPAVGVLTIIEKWAKIGVGNAEELYHSGEATSDNRSYIASNTVYNVLDEMKISVDDNKKILIEAAIKEAVLNLGHTKDAVIKDIENPVEIVTINPIKKYVDENGVELQPISAATSTAIAQ